MPQRSTVSAVAPHGSYASILEGFLDFLDAIGTDWNISLFHYRNHGSDHGRVLAGIDVPAEETDDLEAHLSRLGYAHWEESGNPAYSMFLS